MQAILLVGKLLNWSQRHLDECPRPKKSGKLRLKTYMAPVLEGKSIGSDPKTVLKGELLIWRTKNQAKGLKVYSPTQGLNLLQISPNWFLGNWMRLDPGLKWGLRPCALYNGLNPKLEPHCRSLLLEMTPL